MSSFVVTDQTVNRILGFASMKAMGNRLMSEPARAFFRAVNLPERDATNKDLATLGEQIITLNLAAVEARYGEGKAQHATDAERTFQYRSVLQTSPMQAYKSLNCLLYQLSEGDVPETALYKALEAFQISIGHVILCETKEYETAIWDG